MDNNHDDQSRKRTRNDNNDGNEQNNDQQHHDKFYKGLLKKLECPLCLEIMLPPIQQCTNGHSICSNCYDQLTPLPKKCSYCSANMTTPVRNRSLEDMASSFIAPCRYSDSGCTEEVMYSDLSYHVQSCEHRPIECLNCGEMCTNWDNLLQHLKEKHPRSFKINKKCTKEYGTAFATNGLNPILPANRTDDLYKFLKIFNMVDSSGFNVHLSPFLLYSIVRKHFYIGIHEIGQPQPERNYEITVSSHDSNSVREKNMTISPIKAISYRIQHIEDLMKSKNLIECLSISEEIMKHISNNYTHRLNLGIRAII